jgi:hypothetical protein
VLSRWRGARCSLGGAARGARSKRRGPRWAGMLGCSLMSYEKKFESFIKLCADAKKGGVDVVVVHHPQVIGDNYEEMVESLNRLADADLSLHILPKSKR